MINVGISQPPPVVYVDPPVTIGMMESFDINISVTFLLGLQGWEFHLKFDPTVLQAYNVTEGPFLEDAAQKVGASTEFASEINNYVGNVSAVCGFVPLKGPYDGAVGAGVLATVTFNVTQKWKSDLHFTETKLSTSVVNEDPPPTYLPAPMAQGVPEDGLYLSHDGLYLYVIARAYETSQGEPSYNYLADLDNDNDVDYDDLSLYAESYGQ